MKKFRILVFICLIIAIITFSAYFLISGTRNKKEKRTNTACLTEERLFDYHDALSSSEEAELLEMIENYQEELSMDIVIVTLDNSTDLSSVGLESYGNTNSTYIAETFCDYYRYGWEDWSTNHNQATTSIVIAANWDTGDAWMCTSGRAKELISDSQASAIVQAGCEYLRSDPLKGFEIMLNHSRRIMKGKPLLSIPVCLLIAIVAAVIFFVLNFSKKEGKDTTDCTTYVEGGQAKLLNRQDLFINKTVTSVHIESSSGGGGGGGGHSSGGSHGGGGGHF